MSRNISFFGCKSKWERFSKTEESLYQKIHLALLTIGYSLLHLLFAPVDVVLHPLILLKLQNMRQ